MCHPNMLEMFEFDCGISVCQQNTNIQYTCILCLQFIIINVLSISLRKCLKQGRGIAAYFSG